MRIIMILITYNNTNSNNYNNTHNGTYIIKRCDIGTFNWNVPMWRLIMYKCLLFVFMFYVDLFL